MLLQVAHIVEPDSLSDRLDDWDLIPSRDRDAYVFTITSSLILGGLCIIL